MEKKQFFWLAGILISIQLLGIAFISRQISNQTNDTIYAPANQRIIDEQNSHENPLVTAAIKLPSEEALRKTIAAVLKSELKAFKDKSGNAQFAAGNSRQSARTARANTAATTATIDPRLSEDALAKSYNVIDQAIENGTWTSNSNNELAENLANLNEQQRIKLINKITNAIEHGNIRLENGVVPVI